MATSETASPERCRSVLEHVLEHTSAPSGTAKRLIDEFGSLPALLSVSDDRLARAAQSTSVATTIIQFRQAMLYTLRAELAAGPLLDNYSALIDYLHADMAHHTIERFRVLHLNTRNRLLRDEVMQEGSIDQAPAYIREIVRRAIEIGSSALIMVHNHPSGDASPSKPDITITRAVAQASRPFGIVVHDHLVIASTGYVSMRAKGLI